MTSTPTADRNATVPIGAEAAVAGYTLADIEQQILDSTDPRAPGDRADSADGTGAAPDRSAADSAAGDGGRPALSDSTDILTRRPPSGEQGERR